MTYAAETKVSVAKTRDEIRRLVVDKHHATHFGVMDEPGMSIVVFRLGNRNIRFNLPLTRPHPGERAAENARREKLSVPAGAPCCW